MKVLVTGAAGYIGSKLVPYLIAQGHKVLAVDLGIFGTNHCGFDVFIGDVEAPQEMWFDGVDAVIHLAGLSTDPQAAFSPAENFRYNATGALTTAHMAKRLGVRRFIFASSCSVYAGSSGELRTERDVPKTDYPYGIGKIMAERGLQSLDDDTFHTVVLRKGTVSGASPRFRADLIINTMVVTALSERVIRVHDPDVWRPLLHIDDAVEAYRWALVAPPGVYNVASVNRQIYQVAREVHDALLNFGYEVPVEVLFAREGRNYQVSTDRLQSQWGWVPRLEVVDMVNSVIAGLPEDYTNPKYKNLTLWRQWLNR